VDNSLVIALNKNLVFHDRSKHIDIQFHYLRDYIINKEVEVKDVKIQYQVTYIFTKPLKHDVFANLRDML
jgi:beta-xylosidase